MQPARMSHRSFFRCDCPAFARSSACDRATFRLSDARLDRLICINIQHFHRPPRSARARVPLTLEGRNRVRSLLTRREQASGVAGDPMQSDPLRIVLDGVAPTDTGAQGGYFYKILLNRPSRGVAQPEQTYLIGTLGPFEIAAAIHAQSMANGGRLAMQSTARIVLPATDVLRRVWPDSLDALTLSFVRVDGGAPRQTTAITIDRMWVEAEY